MSVFFINRPIFSWVVAIVIMLSGLLAVSKLSVSQYPQIAPTTVNVSANYPGADAATVENSVTKVIEQGLTGIDNLEFMSSNSTSTGNAQITVTFTSAADPDIAQMQVQNKLQLVTSQLPQAVQQNGVTVTKSSSGFLMVIGFVSTDGKMSSVDLADYVDNNLNDTLKRVEGVGDTQLFGSGYAMRIWMDPEKLAKYALMPGDISQAIKAQNAQVSAGQVGALPSVTGQQLNATITARSRLQNPDQFRDIIIKSNADGSMVRLGDVAQVEIGAESFATSANYNGHPTAGLAINLATGANAISTAQAVRDAVETMRPSFPAGMDITYPYDTTPFVKLSIEEVVKTLIEAVVLVFFVMFLFLQNIRATIIPTLAIPVVLLGTFGILELFGYSINTLTMFAMVLAIGLLVDDAIVVVEKFAEEASKLVMVGGKVHKRERAPVIEVFHTCYNGVDRMTVRTARRPTGGGFVHYNDPDRVNTPLALFQIDQADAAMEFARSFGFEVLPWGLNDLAIKHRDVPIHFHGPSATVHALAVSMNDRIAEVASSRGDGRTFLRSLSPDVIRHFNYLEAALTTVDEENIPEELASTIEDILLLPEPQRFNFVASDDPGVVPRMWAALDLWEDRAVRLSVRPDILRHDRNSH
jgi:hypothetical protein